VTTSTENRKKARLTHEGIVIKDKMQKTVIVEITRLVQHPRFKKIVRNKVRYAVHDEDEKAKLGDKVRIMQTRPLSKTKRWRLVEVLSQ
jgi:small subunit ribosomal protein S17